MSAPIDVRGILERAGADPDAPEGSQAWALAQVDASMAELINAAAAAVERDTDSPVWNRLESALARVGGQP